MFDKATIVPSASFDKRIVSSHEPLLPFDDFHPSNERRRKRGPERRTSPASAEAFEAIKHSRVRLYLPILEVITQHGPEPGRCLTAREILRALKARGDLPHDAERNSVSPRLTELLDAGCVENPDGFLKEVAGDATASVWRITERGRLLLEHLRSQGDRG